MRNPIQAEIIRERRVSNQHDVTPSSQATADAVASAWPGGWYVYENGRVEGPMSASDAFGLASETADGKPRLVSRKGFSQWYALKDLSEIFRLTDQMGKKAESVRAEVVATAPTTVAAPVASAFITPAPPPPKASAKPPLPTPEKRSLKNKKSRSLAAPVSEPEPKPIPGPFSVTEKKPLPEAAKAARVPEKKKSARELTAQALLMQEFFLQRGRLRLGKIRNPWITGFLGLPASLGAYWAVWYGDLARELAFHSQAKEPSKADAWLAIIPIVHLFMIHKLAKAVVAMEGQNQYRSVSPGLAVLFGILPPFALAYLQDAANRHWLLHAKHALAKRRAEEAGT